MATLNEIETNYIEDILIEKGISYETLRMDLLDHICCMVEDKIDKGYEFDQSLNLSLKEFGIEDIYSIQEATLYLLTLNLRIMKKALGIISIATSIFVILGVIFKIYHYPGANMLLLMGLIFTGLIVFPLYMIVDFKSIQSKLSRFSNLVGYFSASILCFAGLFKTLHWPGANILFYVGISLLIFIFMPLYTLKNYKIAENKLFAISKSLLIMAGIIVFIGLVPNQFTKKISSSQNQQIEIVE